MASADPLMSIPSHVRTQKFSNGYPAARGITSITGLFREAEDRQRRLCEETN